MNDLLAKKNPAEKHWERAIVSIKMHTFFSSIEQFDNLTLRNRAIGVINDKNGKLLFCCSNEAEQLGIRKGMKIKDAKRLSPSVVLTPARYDRYAEASESIITALSKITTTIEVNSINHLYLDITRVQNNYGQPEAIVDLIEQTIQKVHPGLSISIGLAGDKTTAAYAASSNNKNSIVVIPPCLSEQRLRNIPLERLDGVSRSTALYLARRGIHRCGDMKNIEIETLVKHLGNEGKQLWYMTQGLDPSPIRSTPTAKKTFTETYQLPENVMRDFSAIKNSISKMSQSLSMRLQAEQLQSHRFHIALNLENRGWIAKSFDLATPVYTRKDLYQIGLKFLMGKWRREAITQIKLCVLNLDDATTQTDLFDENQEATLRVNACR